MITMPANSTGWWLHCIARETGRLGHLYSPGDQRGPWPWFPYALDNGAFKCWEPKGNTFDYQKWDKIEPLWKNLLTWANFNGDCLWAIVPDIPGNGDLTLARYNKYVGFVVNSGIKPALAVQDGMTVEQVKQLAVQPHCIAVGGTTEFKWNTLEMWCKSFSNVHVLRCNSPEKLYYLESLGVNSCDGTGWTRGDKKQAEGLERWAYSRADPIRCWVTPYKFRPSKVESQMTFI